MMKHGMVLCALLLVAAPAAAAGDAEEKFHQAYAREVVEGDVKGAALVYLSLMSDPDAPLEIRAESRFRFAVCAVLLGRADEGRAQLSELVRDPKTPESVRKKAEEYRAAVAGIGMGTELSKKLQSLVFDLGRANESGNVPSYRDFEIIGKPAIPFLRRLLHHPDHRLRIHAFRLLCRMNEPGMAAVWNPDEAPLDSIPYSSDLTHYLTSHPGEKRAFEKRVLALGDKAVSWLGEMAPAPSFSLEFLQALAAKGAWRSTALRFLGWAGEPGPRHAMIARWITGEDADLSRETALWLITHYADRLPEELATPEVFEAVVARLAGPGGLPPRSAQSQVWKGIRTLAGPRTASELMDALGVVIGEGERWEGNAQANPMTGILPDTIASVLDSKLGPETDLKAYAELLDRWARIQKGLPAGPGGRKGAIVPGPKLAGHYAAVVRALPEERAVKEIRRLLDLHGRQNAASWLGILVAPVDSARRVRIFVQTVRMAAPGERRRLADLLPILRGSLIEGEPAEASLDAVVQLFPLLDLQVLTKILYYAFTRTLERLEPGKARAKLLALLDLLPRLDEPRRKFAVSMASGAGGGFAYLGEVVAPVAAEVWDRLSPPDRRAYLGTMLAALQRPASPDGESDRGREVIRSFVRAHYRDLDRVRFAMLCRLPDLFPLEEWIPLAPPGLNLSPCPGQVELDRVARLLGKDAAKANAAVIEFIMKYASPAIRTEVFERGLALADREARQRYSFRLPRFTGPLPGGDVLEQTLAAVLGEKDPDLQEVSALARALLDQRPSEKLFPAARLLLASSEDPGLIASGIFIAESLGREDLTPDLVRLLDSMDVGIRGAAKKAIDAIREVTRIKNEEKLKQAGFVPK